MLDTILPENYQSLFTEWTHLLDIQDNKAADAFYFSQIMPAILPIMRARSGNLPKYKGVISLLGFTPETVILTSHLLKPEKLIILHTPETENMFDIIKIHSQIPIRNIWSEKFLHDEEHIDDIYIALKKALVHFDANDRIAIELTGGKKTMGVQLSNAAAALRHNLKISVDIVYIDYDEYLPKYRKPVPETSRLLIIGDPPALAYSIFGRIKNTSTETREIIVDPVFKGRSVPLKQDLVFTLMPFGESWSNRIWKIIREECTKLGFQAKRADDLFGQDIVEDIWMSILQARIVIADITNRNPNVFYELGIAHTIGKRFVLLTQDVKDIPFDVNRYRHIIYADNA